MRTRFMTALAAGAVVLAGCGGDNTGPSGNELSSSEQAALAQALTANGGVEGSAGVYAAALFGQIKSYGTMSTAAAANAAAAGGKQVAALVHSAGEDYAAVGVELVINAKFKTDANADTTGTVAIAGVIGWNGLDASAKTVDHLVEAYGIFESEPTTGSSSFGTDEDVVGAYYDRATGSTYFATSGSVSLDSHSFNGPSKDCSQSSQGVTVECVAKAGTMRGTLGFDAAKEEGTGDETFSFPNTSWDVPAVRVTLDIDLRSIPDASAPKFIARH